MISAERLALQRNVNCSRLLHELRQRAEQRIETWKISGLPGDQRMARDDCNAVLNQAALENNNSLYNAYVTIKASLVY